MVTAFDVVTGMAIVGSNLMKLSSLKSIFEIWRAKSTLAYPAAPFISGLCNALLNILYASLTMQESVVYSTMIGASINTFCLIMHLIYTGERLAILNRFFFCMLCTFLTVLIIPAAVIFFVSLPRCKQITTTWLGVCMTIMSTIVYSAQLVKFRSIVATKNSASISPYLTAGTTYSTCMWTAYSIMQGDWFYFASSVIGVASSTIQIVFLVIYPRIFAVPADLEMPTKEPSTN